MIKMKHRLNLDIKDPNYTLLKEIFKIMDCKETSEILASNGLKTLTNKYLHLKSYSSACSLDQTFHQNQ